jgi:hypothetical protein
LALNVCQPRLEGVYSLFGRNTGIRREETVALEYLREFVEVLAHAELIRDISNIVSPCTSRRAYVFGLLVGAILRWLCKEIRVHAESAIEPPL